MKRIIKMLRMSVLVAISVAFMFSLSFAQPPIEPKQPIIPPVDPEDLRRRLQTKADLSVTAIFASNCKCDLSDVKKT